MSTPTPTPTPKPPTETEILHQESVQVQRDYGKWNERLQGNLDEISNTEKRKQYFQGEMNSTLLDFNQILQYVYYGLAILVILVVYSKHKMSKISLAGMALVVLLFPWFIDYIVFGIYRFLRYLGALITGTVYVDI